jgi:acyl carrier protein
MPIVLQVKSLLEDTLGLGARINTLNMDSALLGSIPELDSMTVLSILTGLEERFGFTIEDDEFSGEIFETLGSLVAFVEAKLGR